VNIVTITKRERMWLAMGFATESEKGGGHGNNPKKKKQDGRGTRLAGTRTAVGLGFPPLNASFNVPGSDGGGPSMKNLDGMRTAGIMRRSYHRGITLG
jgi:hypothetical protein